jgi:hypothetical protein
MRHLYVVLLAVAASSCTLYHPMLSTLPAVRQPGDVAAAANWQFPYGAQAAAVASPLPHVLVLAAGGLHAYNTERDSSNNYVRNRQYEAGLGGYLTVDHTWLSAAVGAGQGRSFRYGRLQSRDLLGFSGVGATFGSSGGPGGKRPPVPELLGYYNTHFAQVSARWPDVNRPAKEYGASLRVTQARFTSLMLNNVAQPRASQYYLQAAVLVQQPLWRQLQWQAGAGYDVPLSSISNEAAFGRAPFRAYLGLVYRPGLTRSAAEATL